MSPSVQKFSKTYCILEFFAVRFHSSIGKKDFKRPLRVIPQGWIFPPMIDDATAA